MNKYFCRACGDEFLSDRQQCPDCNRDGEAVIPYTAQAAVHFAEVRLGTERQSGSEFHAISEYCGHPECGLCRAMDQLEDALAAVLKTPEQQADFGVMLMNELRSPWRNIENCPN
jgi:hypothetical protein